MSSVYRIGFTIASVAAVIAPVPKAVQTPIIIRTTQSGKVIP